MPETVRACPACDSTRWRARTDRHGTARGPERYHCWDCGERFDIHHERPTRSATGSRWGTKRNVTEADLDAARRALGIDADG